MIIRTKDFQIPKKLEVNSDTLTPTYGEFYAEPFERGFGVTIGNSLGTGCIYPERSEVSDIRKYYSGGANDNKD